MPESDEIDGINIYQNSYFDKKEFHIILSGEVGSGKSTLIQRLMAHNTRPLSGFLTKKLPPDEEGVCHVYMHDINEKVRRYTMENMIGTCNSQHSIKYPDVFDKLGTKLLQYTEGCLLVMDELGFMESDAKEFQKAVLEALGNQKISILAAVKTRDTQFLSSVRNYPGVNHYQVTEKNREALYDEIMSIMK